VLRPEESAAFKKYLAAGAS